MATTNGMIHLALAIALGIIAYVVIRLWLVIVVGALGLAALALVLAMLGADRRRGGEAITEELTQRSKKGLVDDLTTKDGCKHGGGPRNQHIGDATITPEVKARQRPMSVTRNRFGRTKALRVTPRKR